MSVAVAERGGRDAVDLGELRREPLHERVAAERDDARDVLVLLREQAVAHERERLLAARRPHRVGQVDDEDDREPVDREHELEPGQRADEQRQQQHPDRERRAAPSRARAGGAT